MAKRERNGQGQMARPWLGVEAISTGIEGLDTIIGGGITGGAFIMVVGEPGSGKTVMVQQMCFDWAKRQQSSDQGRKALYFSTISESHEKLIAHISKFDFYDPAQLPDQMEIISLQDAMSQGVAKVAETIVACTRQRRAGLVVVDGFRSLIAVAGSLNQAALLLSQLSAQLNFLGCTLVVTLEQNYRAIADGELLTTADGVIAIYQQRQGAHTVRRLEIPKIRGQVQLDGLHSYEITSSGWRVYPRLEALIKAEGQPDTTVKPSERLSFGSKEIDRMMRGGIPRGSMTMLAGSPSTGKTLLALHYISQAVRESQPSLMLNFGETRQQLIDKASRFDLPFATALESGLLHLYNIPPVEIDTNKIADLIRKEVEQHGIQRLVIDGIDELERATDTEQRSFDYLAALITYMRRMNVSLCVTKSVPRITDTEFDLSDSPIGLVAENLLLLRYTQKENRLYRSILVLKMRDSEYNQTIREFTIDSKGIKVIGQAS